MEGADQQHPGGAAPPTTARTAGKPKTREVAPRYLQARPTPAARPRGGAPALTGRASLAGGSAGWVELQLPNHHASTPLMVHTGSTGGMFTSTRPKARPAAGRSAPGQPTPAPPTTARRPSQQAPRQQQQQVAATPAQAPPRPSEQQQQQPRHCEHDVAPLPDTSAVLQTPQPQLPRMSASLGGPATGLPHAGRLAGAMSADLGTAFPSQRRPADAKGAADRRAQLEAFRQQRKQQQQGGSRPGSSSGGFKEPAPKPTLFKATAATRAGSKSEPGNGGASTAAAATAAKAAASSRGSPSPAASEPAGAAAAALSPGGGGGDTAGLAAAAASPSAFQATMAALSSSGGAKPRGGRASRSSGGGSRTPGVPAPRSEQLAEAAGADALPPASGTKIPKLDLGGLARQQQQLQQPGGGGPAAAPQQQTPRRWSSAGGTAAGDAALPDATPRTLRDAMPSKLPRTPRASGSDADAAAPDTLQTPGQPQAHKAVPPCAGTPRAGSSQRPAGVPQLKLCRLGDAAAAAPAPPHAAGNMSARAGGTSARGVGAAGAAAARGGAGSSHAFGTPPGPGSRSCISGAAAVARAATPPTLPRQAGRTPRGAPPTPRRSSSDAGAAPVAAAVPAAAVAPAAAPDAASAAATRKHDAERAEEVRQQLRLLRMQHLQLRHLNARVEAALHARNEKFAPSIAAAAAAVVDLSGQLLQAQGRAQQERWQAQLQHVLQRQLPVLQKWGEAQARHKANVGKLHAACSAALSHVPLLNGARVGDAAEQPNLEQLQQQLVFAMQLLTDVQPAMQLLLAGDLAPATSPAGAAAPEQQLQQHSVKTTAALAEQLLGVAGEECELHAELSQQLAQLQDLHLYANSLQVQLAHMRRHGMQGVEA